MQTHTKEPAPGEGKGKLRLPLYVRILLGVALGILTGVILKDRAAPLGDIGILVIQLLKALATPLILFAVLDAFLRTRLSARKGATLVVISVVNATVAIGIGLSLSHLTHGGQRWQGQMAALVRQTTTPATSTAASAKAKTEEPAPTLDPLKNLSANIPTSFLDPFVKNNVIAVVLLAVLMGAALRKMKDARQAEVATGLQTIEDVVHAAFHLFTQILEWIIQILPFAVFGVVAKVVGKTGPSVFLILGDFLAIVLIGLLLQSVVYYSLLLWTVGRTSPRRFYGGAMDAIVTALSCGSSLATLPVTLRCLHDRLKVSPDSARLAACVGTNLNHDGIILYEAVAALFVAQAFGYTLSLSQQVTVALASVMAGIGIAGVPEAGLITLPLVLSAAGLPAPLVATIIPIILPVDWIIGRGRAATNVLSDMTVATLLDRLHPISDRSLTDRSSGIAAGEGDISRA